jgi:transposase
MKLNRLKLGGVESEEKKMPVRPLNRQQTWLLPPTLDELIPNDHPARFVATMVDSLEAATWQKMEISLEGDDRGTPAYHPRAMLSVWLYGFMTRTRSSRKLEAACRDQITYLWLTGWQHPDHNSLWRFYKAHRDEMRQLFKLTVKTAVKMNLVDLAIQAVDGSKIGANAAKERTHDLKSLAKLSERTEQSIQELEKENESNNEASPVHLPEKLKQAKQLREEIKKAMATLAEEEEGKNINLTDPEAKLVKTRQGTTPGYNLQAVVSPLKLEGEKSSLIITAVDVVTDAADTKQLLPMLKQAAENNGQPAEKSLADAGYYSGANLAGCEKETQIIVMPDSHAWAHRNPYHKDYFTYEVESNSYCCPCGQTLRRVGQKYLRAVLVQIYRGSAKICCQCSAFGICTRNKRQGRELKIGEYEPQIGRHRNWMQSEEAKAAYKRRKELVEPSFGIIKEEMGVRRFLLRGWGNVRAEGTVLAIAFNLRSLYRAWKQWLPTKRQQLAAALKAGNINQCFFRLANVYT